MPYEFTFGIGQVPRGWEEGIGGTKADGSSAPMKVGGIRIMTVPSEIADGKAGSPPVIPPDSVLIYEIEVLKMEEPAVPPQIAPTQSVIPGSKPTPIRK